MTFPAEAIARSPAAERMRLHRERKRQGLRCLTIELRETEIDALIHEGLLQVDARNKIDVVCSETKILDRYWLESSAVIPRLEGAESDEGIEVFGGAEGVHSQAGC